MEQVTIYLGSKCNLSCSYCHREESEKEVGITDEYLQELKNIKNLRVKFIGGEPTLYMDEIQKVVESLPKAKFAISTNGILFEKYRDYFLRNQFHVAISYDGGTSDLRGYDPFQTLISYPYLGVSTTLYHGNTDFTKIMRRLAEKERIIGRSLSFFPHIMHHTSKLNAPYALTYQDMHHIYEQWKEWVEKLVCEYEEYGIVNQRLLGLFAGLYKKREYRFGETYCVNKNIHKTTADGKEVSCLYIRNDILPKGKEERRKALGTIIQKKFPKCKSCHWYSYCGAGCIKSIAHPLECYFYKRLYSWWDGFYKKHKTAIEELGEHIQ